MLQDLACCLSSSFHWKHTYIVAHFLHVCLHVQADRPLSDILRDVCSRQQGKHVVKNLNLQSCSED